MTGLPAARQTDKTLKGGPITQGSLTVNIGSAGGVACSTCPGGKAVGNPVNPVLGAKVQGNEVDLALPGPLPFVVSRDYSSYQTDTPANIGLLGPGWWLPTEASLLQTESELTLNDSKGRSIRFDPLPAGRAAYSRSENLWIVRGGLERLDEEPSMPTARLNTAWLGLHLDDRRNPSFFFVTNDPLGPWWIFGPQPALAEIEGKRLHLLGLADRFGRTQKLGRDASGAMTAVQDGAGRQYRLELKQLPHLANHGQNGWGADSGVRLMAVHLTHDPHYPERLAHPLVRYEYSARGELMTVYARDASVQRRFWYHPKLVGRMTAHAYAGREPVTYTYDESGKVIAHDRPGSLSYRFDYQAQATVVTDSLGRQNTYHFEGEGGLKRVVRQVAFDGGISQSHFDPSGRLLSSIDPLGRETRFDLDTATGAVLSITLPDGAQSSWNHNPHGQVILRRNTSGATERFEYDELGRPTATIDALGHITRTHYPNEETEQPNTIEDAKGGFKLLTWTSTQQLASYTDCSGSVTRYRYNRWGQQVQVQGEEGSRIDYSYDELGRLIAQTNAANQTSSYGYNAASDVMAISAPDGNTVRFERDALGRMLVYHYGGLTQQYQYDPAGRLVRLTNENGAHTTFDYDVMDRLTKQVNFDGRTQTYLFNAASEVMQSDDEGLINHFQYDKVGRLLKRQTVLPNGAEQDVAHLHFEYELGGAMRKAWHQTAIGGNLISVQFERDELGRISEEVQQITDAQGGEVWRHSVEHEFDALGVEIQTTYEGLPPIKWQTYGAGHLHGVILDGKTLIDFERDKLHRETRRTFGGVEITKTYDPLSRLSQVQAQSPMVGDNSVGDSLNSMHHYDLAGQLTKIETAKGPHQYQYDKAGRLVGAVQPGLAPQQYRFDPAGNRIFKNQHAGSAKENWDETVRQHLNDKEFNLLGKNAAMDSHHTEQRWMDNRILDDGEFKYEYDQWGNLRRKYKAEGNEQHYFIYDSSHRLVRYGFESDEAVRGANYHYDPFGRRMVKQVQHADGNGNLTEKLQSSYFGWDGDRLVVTEKDGLQIHTLYELGSFAPMIRIKGSGDQPKRLVQKLQEHQCINLDKKAEMAINGLELELREDRLSAFSQKWMQEAQLHSEALSAMLDKESSMNGKQIHSYQCNHLGTPQALIDPHGRLAWAAQIEPWGNVSVEYNPEGQYQPIRLQGQHFDSESGLSYNRHRYYAASSGGYITQDPIGLLGGLNPSSYPLNPTKAVDPLGLWASQKGYYVHQRAGYLVFGNEISSSQLAAVARGHIWADNPEHQTSEFTHMHAMRRPGQSKAQACQATNEYIKNEAQKALDAKASGKTEDAFFHFGAALHAIQDSTSPSHAGFQEWSGHESRSEQVSHASKELFLPDEDSALFQNTRRAWEAFKKGDINGFSCQCD